MKELKPKLLFSFSEYSGSWSNLLVEFYLRIVNNEDIHGQNLESNGKLSVVLPSLMSIFLSNSAKISAKIIDDLEKNILENFAANIFDNNETDIESWLQYHHDYSVIVKQLIKHSGKDFTLTEQMIGLSKMILDVKAATNEENEKSIQLLAMELLEVSQAFLKFAENSAVSSKIFGKPNFIVLRD